MAFPVPRPMTPMISVHRNRTGFTLIELLVALVLSGILGGIVLQFLLGQGQFARLQGAREEVQQNARSALTIIAGELRAVPPGAIREANETSIRFYLPRVWGMLCEDLELGDDEAWFRFPTVLLDNAGGVPNEVMPGRGIAVAQTDIPGETSTSGAYLFTAAKKGTGTTNACPNTLGTITGMKDEHISAVGGAIITSGTAPVAGAPAFLYEEMMYNVASATVGGVPADWLLRTAGFDEAGDPVQKPLAGPVPGSGNEPGLEFTYFGTNGQSLAAPGTDPGSIANIASVRVTVVMNSRAEFNDQPQQDRASTVVFLRN